jgi:hypothetical protein
MLAPFTKVAYAVCLLDGAVLGLAFCSPLSQAMRPDDPSSAGPGTQSLSWWAAAVLAATARNRGLMPEPRSVVLSSRGPHLASPQLAVRQMN